MSLSSHVKNEIKQCVDAGFTDQQSVESLNASGLTRADGKPFTRSAFAYYRSSMGFKKPGGKLRRRRAAPKAIETSAQVRQNGYASLKDACIALLDCAPAQRSERITLVFKLLGVK